MQIIEWSKNWLYKKKNDSDFQLVQLPHDPMIAEQRLSTNLGGKHTAWLSGCDYIYEKEIVVTETDLQGVIYLLLEGAYHSPNVYLNERKIAFHPYGYSELLVDLSPHLRLGSNTLRIETTNSDQPNSRWYTGSGIYRPVHLLYAPPHHIVWNSVAITTLDHRLPTIQVDFQLKRPGAVTLQIYDGVKVLHEQMLQGELSNSIVLTLPRCNLWSPEHPQLYSCVLTYGSDQHTTRFGIRTVHVSSEHGFSLNGERLILLGACVHHDNGIIGANGHPYAEYRKALLLKKSGFNAVRSAHNPISRAFLDACDEIGLLVVDELADMWYIHKTKNDYATYFPQWWQYDLQSMVRKDRNHPCVIMYSIGNEVAETSEPRGIDLTRQMTAYLHQLDTRPVTCGVNIFFNYLYSLGFGVYSDNKSNQDVKKHQKEKPVGSEFFNELAGKFGDQTMKIGAWLPGSDRKTKDAFRELDVAGYNYGILRYKKDVKKYPKRVILGSETFCKDAAYFHKMAQQHPQIIGDFVWSGFDYLGEVGVGSWVSHHITTDYTYGPGWMTAGSGRIDILGNPLSEMDYLRVAYGLDVVRCGVVPPNEYKKQHSPSAWKMTNAIESWSWHGCEGLATVVEVYSLAHHVELFLNQRLIGKKRPPAHGRTYFKVAYQPGELVAVAYQSNGQELGRTILTSSQPDTKLTLTPEASTITQNQLAYVHVKLTDQQGTVQPLQKADVQVQVTNGTLLGYGNACPYHSRSYQDTTAETYYGVALAIIQPLKPGVIRVEANSSFGAAVTSISVE